MHLRAGVNKEFLHLWCPKSRQKTIEGIDRNSLFSIGNYWSKSVDIHQIALRNPTKWRARIGQKRMPKQSRWEGQFDPKQNHLRVQTTLSNNYEMRYFWTSLFGRASAVASAMASVGPPPWNQSHDTCPQCQPLSQVHPWPPQLCVCMLGSECFAFFL